jgi:hypothetical protein
MANSASWLGATGVGGIYYKTGVGLVMRKADNSEVTLGSGGGSSTLALAYAAGASQADSTMTLDATRLGLKILDAASTVGTLLQVQNNGATTTYFNLTANSTQQLKSGMADGATAEAFRIDTTSTWVNAAARIATFRNGGTSKLEIDVSGNLLPKSDDGPSLGSGSLRFHTIWLSGAAGSAIFGAGGTASLTLNDSTGASISYGANSLLSIGTSSISFRSNAPGSGATDVGLAITTQNAFSAAGASLLSMISAAATSVYLGMFTGSNAFSTPVAIDVIADATCTAGNVLIWSNTNGSGRVKDATAAANLTTIAGVCVVGGAAGATVKMAIRGRCFVNAVSGVTAQQLLGTSGVTAGNVVGATPGSGALVGLSLEARGATIANQVLCDLRIS